MYDINKIRKDFPILSEQIYNKPLIYFDNGATTQKPICVIDCIKESYEKINANVHRGVHYLSQIATDHMEQTRRTVASFINAKEQEIIFTKGTTDGFNLLASSFCETYCKKDDEIIISEMEHHANIVPWQLEASRKGIVLKVLPMTDDGELIINELEKMITNKTKLISITHISNVLGTINPIVQITNIAHSYNIPIAIDAAQSIQHLPIDVRVLDCDFLLFSAHKLYGPTGVGILYGKEKYLSEMKPYQGGGEMISHVSFEKTTFNELPFKFEAGTPNYIDIIAFNEAIKYVLEIGLNNISSHENELNRYFEDQLKQVPLLKIYGNARNKTSAISFLIGKIHPYDLGMLLDKMGIAVRTGHHCAQPLMTRLGIEGTVRASLAMYNTKEEIDIFMTSLDKVTSILS